MAIELKRDMMKESENGKGKMDIDFRALRSQMKALEELRDSDIFEAGDWRESIGAIIDFQRVDGSFSFFSDYHIPSDGRVLYIYRPSYACCQILIRAVVAGKGDAQIEDALERGLAFCCTRNLVGHGFDGLSQQIEDVENFIRCGALSLAATHPGQAPRIARNEARVGSRILTPFGGFACRPPSYRGWKADVPPFPVPPRAAAL